MPLAAHPHFFRLAAAALAGPLVAACSHQDPADRSVENLRAEITKIQADRDRLEERVGALEAAEQKREGAAKPPEPRALPPRPAPPLPAGSLGDRPGPPPPDGLERESVDTDGSEPRP